MYILRSTIHSLYKEERTNFVFFSLIYLVISHHIFFFNNSDFELRPISYDIIHLPPVLATHTCNC